jgi:hypothetical protein
MGRAQRLLADRERAIDEGPAVATSPPLRWLAARLMRSWPRGMLGAEPLLLDLGARARACAEA